MSMIRKTLSGGLLALVSLISLFPFYAMAMMTTHTTESIFRGEFLLPGRHLWTNLQTVLASSFIHSFWNSAIVSILSTIICVFICALTGFALSKYEFRLRKFVFSFIIATMMVPSQIGLVGYIMEMRFLQLNQSLIPLVLVWTTNAFGVFWMVQYMKGGVHNELLESARVDGCSEPRIFLQIVLPVIRPAIATLALVIFLWSWNSYLLPLVLINKESLFTIPLSIQSLGNYYRTDYGARMTGLMIAVLPLIVLFVVGAKNFIQGLTAGAVKG